MNDHRPYRILPFDPHWTILFQRHAEIIRSVLNKEVLDIQHVGSTSISGMWAKPNIDIMVVVPEISRIKRFRDAMESLGYTAHGDYSHIKEEYFTEDLPSGERLTSIHVFQKGNPEIQSHINFRDYLINNENARKRYIEIKRNLAHEKGLHYRAYDDGKQQLISQLNKEAAEWAVSKSAKLL